MTDSIKDIDLHKLECMVANGMNFILPKNIKWIALMIKPNKEDPDFSTICMVASDMDIREITAILTYQARALNDGIVTSRPVDADGDDIPPKDKMS